MYDIIIPVYKPGQEFNKLIRAIAAQTVIPRRLIIIESVDAGGESKTRDLDIPEGIELVRLVIDAVDFDHAGSRNLAINESGTDYFICLTQDAVPAGPNVMERLLEPLITKKAVISYARQIPSKNATARERLTRGFNYPDTSVIKSAGDKEFLGIKTFFCSNACAAYDRKTFDKLGGFTAPAIFNEDMVYAKGVIENGGNIAYVADARVIHSHDYTLAQDFSRSFDLGVSQAMHPEVFFDTSSESEGVSYVLKLTGELAASGNIIEVPPLICHSGVRFVGYRLGKLYKRLPVSAVKRFSMNKKFWKF